MKHIYSGENVGNHSYTIFTLEMLLMNCRIAVFTK